MGARALIAALVLLFSACGPRPRVAEARVRAGPDGRVVVDVLVENPGGEGEASVTVRLRDRRDGREYVREQGVTLERGRPAACVVEVGAPPGDYELSAVDVRYPP